MTTFPAGFDGAIRSGHNAFSVIRGDGDRLRWFPGLIRPSIRAGAIALLERHLAPHLRPVRRQVAPETITGMKQNYTESLPKSMCNRSAMLNGSRSAAAKAARAIGLVQFLTSPSLREFAELVSGYPLERSPGLQVICYRPGDYVGPHNDHHPEEPHLRHGYIDLQITLTNDDVARQYLIYERDGFFNQTVDIGIPSGVSVSMLPFWHQVTPLMARKGKEETARRWLLLVSFIIKPE